MQKNYNRETIASWDRFYRANFINSMSGYKSVSLIGTKSKDGRSNLAIFSNIVHLGADPPLIGFVNRPLEAAPHTLTNIQDTGIYTINLITTSFIDKAHQTSAKYLQTQNEFEKVGLEEVYLENISAPFVKISPLKYALELKEVIPITHNRTFFVIGEVTSIFINDELISNDGYLHLEKASIISSLGIDGYYKPDFISRYEYAKPDVPTARKSTIDYSK